MKALIVALMLLVATSGLAAPFAVDDPTDLTGAWVVSIQTGDSVVTSDAVLTTDGQNVFGTLTSAAGDLRVFGTFDSGAVHMYADSGPETQVALALTGERTPGTISGTALVSGVGQMNWTARRK